MGLDYLICDQAGYEYCVAIKMAPAANLKIGSRKALCEDEFI